MSDVLRVLLHMTLTGSVVILAVFLLRLPLRRAPKIYSYALWIAVLLRLLCPVMPEAGFSALGAGQKLFSWSMERMISGNRVDTDYRARRLEAILDHIGAREPQSQGFTGHSGVSGFRPAGSELAHTGAAGAGDLSAGRTVLFGKRADAILFFLWLGGAAVLLAYTLFGSVRLHRFLRTAEQEEKNIYVKDGIDTPFVAGLFVPRIYLPAGLLGQERKYILLHENTHIRRGDPWFRRLAFLALVLHWFNPLVWAAFLASGRDMEMSCDENVIRTLGSGIKKEYSNSLLTMSTGNTVLSPDADEHSVGNRYASMPKGIMYGMPLAFGEGDTGKRIRNILLFKRAKTWVAVLCVCVLALTLIVFVTDPKTADGAEDAARTTEFSENSESAQANPSGNMEKHTLQEESQNAADTVESVLKNEDYENYADEFGATVYVQSVSRSARAIDRMKGTDIYARSLAEIDEKKARLGDCPVFSEDCIFLVNESVGSMEEREVSFDEFADYFSGGDGDIAWPCEIGVRDGQICFILLMSSQYDSGISYAQNPHRNRAYTVYDELKEMYGEDFLDRFTLVRTEYGDVSDAVGYETIEIYCGQEDGKCGVVLFKSSDGKLLHCEFAHESRAGWNNIYYGKMDGVGFILTLELDNRGTNGEYTYHVYRIDENGSVVQYEGSTFFWNSYDEFVQNEKAYQLWSVNLGRFMDESYLLLGTDNGELRCEKENDRERYCYSTLNPEIP